MGARDDLLSCVRLDGLSAAAEKVPRPLAGRKKLYYTEQNEGRETGK